MTTFEPRLIPTSFGTITIRPYEERDIPQQAQYLFDSSDEFRILIGLEPSKLQDKTAWEALKKIRHDISLQNDELPTSIVAEINGTAISMVFLDLRAQDGIPRLHFHILSPELRGKGLGSVIFMAGCDIFSILYKTKKFFIEPKESNQRMNRLMQKLNFKYIKNFSLEAGPITHEMVVNQYEINL